MKILNKKARHDYFILSTYEAGISLLGFEVKSLKEGRGKLEGSFARVIGFEAFLVNAEIYPYSYSRSEDYNPRRTRKLLLHKKQIIAIKTKLESSNLTLIPLEWYTKGPIIKLKIGLARGKKKYDKREQERKKHLQRDLDRKYKLRLS